jgi:hypothetical protein
MLHSVKLLEQGVAEGNEGRPLYTGKDNQGTVTITYEPAVDRTYSYCVRFNGKLVLQMRSLDMAVYGLTHSHFDTFRPDLQPNPKTALQQGVAEGSTKTDMTGKTCEKCGQGKYKETTQHDDMDGVLHCTNCNKKVDRWRSYKEQGVKEGTDYKQMFESKLTEMGVGSVASAPMTPNAGAGTLFGGSYSQKDSPFAKKQTKKRTGKMIKR